MKQLDIFEFLKENSGSGGNRLVNNNGLTSLHYRVLDYLKHNALGKENIKNSNDIIEYFYLDSSVQVRNLIRDLRTHPSVDVVIGSTVKGYYIPKQDELIEAVSYMIGKTLSQIETLVNMFPPSADAIHRVAQFFYQKADKAPQGQQQMKFNGWEKDYITRYADDYIKKLEKGNKENE